MFRLANEAALSELQRKIGKPSAIPVKPAHKPRAVRHENEKALWFQLHDAGLPVAYREFVFDPVRDWRLDLAWPALKLAVEIDGGVHRIKERFARDIEKRNAAVMQGWRLIHVTPAQVRDGEALGIVREALERFTTATE